MLRTAPATTREIHRYADSRVHGVRRVDILGCPFDAISLEETAARIQEAVIGGLRLQVVPGSIDTIARQRRDPDFQALLWSCDLVVADGQPVTWLASLLGDPIRGRVSGTELVWRCAEISSQTGSVVALIGGCGDVAARAAVKMKQHFPKANLRSIETPFPLSNDKSALISQEAKRLGARIVLAALGAPRQERWIREWLQPCGACVGIGIGSAFDIISGDRPRAPEFLQNLGFEWFYRMLLEPRRLGRRYLIEDTPVLAWLVREFIQRKRRGNG